jgi:hypothetical protein
MAQFTIYRSYDASAPVLTGEVSKLVDLLDACLVNGYGAKAAAGWAITYTDTGKRVYRPGAGNQLYFRIDDNGPGAGTYKEARLRGYETMSDVDTGTGLFPTAVQAANGVFIRKSAAASATARDWIVIADSRTCYGFIQTADSPGVFYCFGFGDFYSLISGDGFNSFVCARTTENSATASFDRLDSDVRAGTATEFYVTRPYSAIGTCENCGRHGDGAYNSLGWLGGTLIFPNITESVLASRIWITEPTSTGIRGWVRGLWNFLHPVASVGTNHVSNGSEELAGKTFLFLKPGALGGIFMLETSDTLDTN